MEPWGASRGDRRVDTAFWRSSSARRKKPPKISQPTHTNVCNTRTVILAGQARARGSDTRRHSWINDQSAAQSVQHRLRQHSTQLEHRRPADDLLRRHHFPRGLSLRGRLVGGLVVRVDLRRVHQLELPACKERPKPLSDPTARAARRQRKNRKALF